jgi:hypothetical protein
MTTFLTTIILTSSHSLMGSHGFFKITHSYSLNMRTYLLKLTTKYQTKQFNNKICKTIDKFSLMKYYKSDF